jgi:hypothetical protein
VKLSIKRPRLRVPATCSRPPARGSARRHRPHRVRTRRRDRTARPRRRHRLIQGRFSTCRTARSLSPTAPSIARRSAPTTWKIRPLATCSRRCHSRAVAQRKATRHSGRRRLGGRQDDGGRGRPCHPGSGPDESSPPVGWSFLWEDSSKTQLLPQRVGESGASRKTEREPPHHSSSGSAHCPVWSRNFPRRSSG